jgi:membrane associated rhomboid family serine protease
MLIDIIFFIALIIIVIFQALFTFVPLGNERSTVRRLPWVTFSIMAGCVVIYYVTLPGTVQQDREWMQTRTKLEEFLKSNPPVMLDEGVRKKLKEGGVRSKEEMDEIERELRKDTDIEYRAKQWLKGSDAISMLAEFDKKYSDYKAASEAHLYFKFGVAPNGNWKAYQLITAIFLHGSTLHLMGNMLFFFAVGFSLEDLWGRGTFLGFYLLAGIAACLPDIISPGPLASIGASGAISATMGAFLIRLYNTRVKIGWVTLTLGIPFIIFGKKPFGVVNVRAYVYLPFYFISNFLPWYFINKAGMVSTTGYAAHLAGFVFGVAFALFMKATKAEETYINPKIEAKVSFSAAPAVTQAIEMLDRGEIVFAERKLKSHLVKNPSDLEAIMAMIQVYEKTGNYEKLNGMYGRLIRYHLDKQDKEAALYAYDNLLSSLPDTNLEVRIPARDWLAVCEYLKESEMFREATVEYERLVKACPSDPLTLKACVDGGEAGLLAHDNQRALRLFETAQTLSPTPAYSSRIEAGIEKCRTRLDNRPEWVKQPPKPRTVSNDVEEQKAHF